MPVKASTSTLRWCREEGGPMFKGLQLIFQSQLGYEGRRLEDRFKQTIIRSVVGPGLVNPMKTTEIPSTPSTFRDSAIDAVQRATAIATGIRTYAGMLMQGVTPGTGGYTVSPSGEKVYGNSMSPSMNIVTGLNKIADMVAKGSIALPKFAMPNLQKLGEKTLEEPYFKESDFVGKKFLRKDGSEGRQNITAADLSPEEAEFLVQAAQSVDDMEAAKKIADSVDLDTATSITDAVHTDTTAKVEERTKDSDPSPNINASLNEGNNPFPHVSAPPIESSSANASNAAKSVGLYTTTSITDAVRANTNLDAEEHKKDHNPFPNIDATSNEDSNSFPHISASPSEDSSSALNTSVPPIEVQKNISAASKVHSDINAAKKNRHKSNAKVYRPSLPFNYEVNTAENLDNMSKSKERKVPATRLGRLISFGQLAVGLAGGAAAEVTRRTLSFGGSTVATGMPRNPFLSQSNADRIVETLCRVRGAALKLGQMLSIQDPDTVPASLLEIFERVRHSADFMPLRQVEKQMVASFDANWRSKFQSFEDRPFAAASIGQVHKAILLDGRKVAVKIQYPGVAEGIDSDIDNLVSVLSLGNIFPKGMFLEEFIKVARRELALECDYLREARAMKKFRELLSDSKDFFVPEVVESFTTKRVLTAEYVLGKPVDECINEPQVVRDYIAGKFIELCLNEIFVWRFMQTDPNWSNFFLGIHPVTGEPRLILLDFGASRSYSKKFVDQYMKIIKAASVNDVEKIVEYSREIGFLTGYESKIMEQAHVESVLIMGETLASDHPYDFSRQNVTKRIRPLIPIMLEHRLSSPPEEIYSLHRKLSGSYLLATKLKAVVSCGGLFNDIYDDYKFGEDGKDIDIDISPNDATDPR